MNKKGLTEFTYTRYLTPWLSEFQRESLFIDADVLVRGDVRELFNLPWENDEAVKVVKSPLRFEWPSVMLFKNARCTILTPDFVETANCNDLAWASGVGALPPEWNYLVGYEEQCGEPKDPKLVHFTQGLPVFEETSDKYKDEFMEVIKHARSSASWEAMMGRSVHKKAMGV